MKRVLTALAIGSLLLGAGYAHATDYTWTGGAPFDDFWQNPANWDVGTSYPGTANNAPNAYIPWVSGHDNPSLGFGLSYALTYVELDAENGAVTLSINNGASIDPGHLRIYGGSSNLATFDFNAGTLANPDSLTMWGLSAIDAEASITMAGATQIGTDGISTSATLDMGSSSFAATTLSISGGSGSGESSSLNHIDGSLSSTSLSLAEGSYANDHSDYAELYLGSDEDGCSASSMSATGYSYVEITSGHTLSISSDCTLGHGAAADSESYVELSGGGSISIDGILTIQGGSSTATTTLEVTNGSIQTY